MTPTFNKRTIVVIDDAELFRKVISSGTHPSGLSDDIRVDTDVYWEVIDGAEIVPGSLIDAWGNVVIAYTIDVINSKERATIKCARKATVDDIKTT